MFYLSTACPSEFARVLMTSSVFLYVLPFNDLPLRVCQSPDDVISIFVCLERGSENLDRRRASGACQVSAGPLPADNQLSLGRACHQSSVTGKDQKYFSYIIFKKPRQLVVVLCYLNILQMYLINVTTVRSKAMF